jgi:starvation-inducible DNA-binding protein
MDINIGLSAQQRQAICSMLNALLADAYLVKTKTLNYHWNVRGIHFYQLHKFFEEQYGELAESIDKIAERVRALDGVAAGTMQEFLNLSRLKEDPTHVTDAKSMIRNLLEDHETQIRQLRADVSKINDNIGDDGTADFLTSLMEKHEKMAWMLRSMLE